MGIRYGSGVAREIGLLINPVAGRGRGARYGAAAAERLRSLGASVREMVGANAADATEVARAAIDEGVDALVVVGGDGMMHLGLQLVGGTQTPFGMIAAGTGNDFARALNLPLRNPVAAADVIMRGEERRVDLGYSEGVWFGCVVAGGFDARVNERANRLTWPHGPMRYNVAMLIEFGVFRPVPYVLELDGIRWETDAMLVSVANGPSFGGGMLVCPGALLDDGMLDVLVLQPLSKAEFLRVFPRVYRGSHVTHRAVEIRRASKVMISAPDIVSYVDGERLGPLPRTFETRPQALRVLAPSRGGMP